MATSNTVAKNLVSGSQDVAALAGLLFSNSVEKSALATHLGYGHMAISRLSLLGILGIVKTAFKITLGRERCTAAGFSLDPVRGIFGYTALEAAANQEIVDCDIVTVHFREKEIIVEKAKRYFHPDSNPLVSVGALWGTGHEGKEGLRLSGFTVLGLGNPERENAWGQNIWLHFILGFIFAGITSWLILLIDAPYNWVWVWATAGMHACLTVLLLIPLYLASKTRRPAAHLTNAAWRALRTGTAEVKRLDFLQCRVGRGNVLHAQGDTTFLHRWPLRVLAFLAAVGVGVAYVCQYAVLNYATDNTARIWMVFQVVAALTRSAYWIINPSFGDTKPEDSTFALIHNNASKTLTLAEFVCALKPGKTVIPLWVWEYLRDTPIDELIRQGASRSTQDIIPTDAEWKAFPGSDFNRIVRHRLPGVLPNHTHHGIALGLWRAKDRTDSTIHPFFLVETVFLLDGQSLLCCMEANRALYNTGHSCNIFAFNHKTEERLHLQPCVNPRKCIPTCQWKGKPTKDSEADLTARFLLDRARMSSELLEQANLQAFEFKPSMANAVIISGKADYKDRSGSWCTLDLQDGLHRLERCIDGEFERDGEFQRVRKKSQTVWGGLRGLTGFFHTLDKDIACSA
ncbi:hypothetical protein K432DRAFT_401221 [Lepidopterella palustris CBS 459.81]|uniref:Uncharacterized protein n=1 Tax=Lepidopterella palustris CBS 459.81 TaxID=1314670 RepID=A0A8E2EHZ3_9PEZI|nr:hypothetical protein K432DRAFT_401221 [Lepidopterella palustris CBS 459.81]